MHILFLSPNNSYLVCCLFVLFKLNRKEIMALKAAGTISCSDEEQRNQRLGLPQSSTLSSLSDLFIYLCANYLKIYSKSRINRVSGILQQFISMTYSYYQLSKICRLPQEFHKPASIELLRTIQYTLLSLRTLYWTQRQPKPQKLQNK